MPFGAFFVHGATSPRREWWSAPLHWERAPNGPACDSFEEGAGSSGDRVPSLPTSGVPYVDCPFLRPAVGPSYEWDAASSFPFRPVSLSVAAAHQNLGRPPRCELSDIPFLVMAPHFDRRVSVEYFLLPYLLPPSARAVFTMHGTWTPACRPRGLSYPSLLIGIPAASPCERRPAAWPSRCLPTQFIAAARTGRTLTPRENWSDSFSLPCSPHHAFYHPCPPKTFFSISFDASVVLRRSPTCLVFRIGPSNWPP